MRIDFGCLFFDKRVGDKKIDKEGGECCIRVGVGLYLSMVFWIF